MVQYFGFILERLALPANAGAGAGYAEYHLANQDPIPEQLLFQ
jgi:hypothetical protein